MTEKSPWDEEKRKRVRRCGADGRNGTGTAIELREKTGAFDYRIGLSECVDHVLGRELEF